MLVALVVRCLQLRLNDESFLQYFTTVYKRNLKLSEGRTWSGLRYNQDTTNFSRWLSWVEKKKPSGIIVCDGVDRNQKSVVKTKEQALKFF